MELAFLCNLFSVVNTRWSAPNWAQSKHVGPFLHINAHLVGGTNMNLLNESIMNLLCLHQGRALLRGVKVIAYIRLVDDNLLMNIFAAARRVIHSESLGKILYRVLVKSYKVHVKGGGFTPKNSLLTFHGKGLKLNSLIFFDFAS